MPNSKKPRHKKKNNAYYALTKYNGLAKIQNMSLILDRDHVVTQCVKVMFEFEQLMYNDLIQPVWFNKAITMLLIGKILTTGLNLPDRDYNDIRRVLEHSAYMLFTAMRIKTKGQQIPLVNVEMIREGLATAQALFQYAQDHNGTAFLNSIYASMGKETDTIEDHVKRHQYLLGDRWETVLKWVNDGEIVFTWDKEETEE